MKNNHLLLTSLLLVFLTFSVVLATETTPGTDEPTPTPTGIISEEPTPTETRRAL